MQRSSSSRLPPLHVSIIICFVFLSEIAVTAFGWEAVAVRGRDGCPAGQRKYGKLDPKCEPDCFEVKFKCEDLYHEELCFCEQWAGYVRNGTSGCIHRDSCPNRPRTSWTGWSLPACKPNMRLTSIGEHCAPTCDRPEFSCKDRVMDDGPCICDFGRGFVLDTATGQCVFVEDCPKKSEPRSSRRNHWSMPACKPNMRLTLIGRHCAPTCDRPEFSCIDRAADDPPCICDFGRDFVLDKATGECVFVKDCPKKSKPRSSRRNHHARHHRGEDS